MTDYRRLRAVASAIEDDDGVQTIVDHLLHLIPDLLEYVIHCDRCETHRSAEGCADIDGECWCQSCVENDAYYWDSDGEYHSEPEPEPDDEIPDYHETDVELHRAIPFDGLGIELETYQRDVSGAAEFLRDMRDECGLKFERDGSLDDDHGVEIVCAPYTLEEIRSGAAPWKRILDWCRTHGATAWDAGTDYGIHINLNGDKMALGHRARLVRFINDNRKLGERIGGRTENCRAKYVARGFESSAKSQEKYCAAANRGSRVEIRLFRATLNWDRFVRNCEYADAVRVYTMTCGMNATGMSEASFLAWLSLPENRATYKLLFKFLVGAKSAESVSAE